MYYIYRGFATHFALNLKCDELLKPCFMDGLNVRPLLHLLGDGKWHSVNNLAEELGWDAREVARAAISVSPLVDFEDESKRVRLRSWVMRLPAPAKNGERKASVGSVIIPPEGDVTIQNVVICNCTEVDIELGVRVVDERLRELMIFKLPRSSSAEAT